MNVSSALAAIAAGVIAAKAVAAIGAALGLTAIEMAALAYFISLAQEVVNSSDKLNVLANPIFAAFQQLKKVNRLATIADWFNQALDLFLTADATVLLDKQTFDAAYREFLTASALYRRCLTLASLDGDNNCRAPVR